MKKIILTNKGALEKKYDINGTTAITSALNMMISADLNRREISSFVILLDDEKQMKLYGAAAVTEAMDERQNKNAIDMLYKKIKPDYILLLGGPDIIPHQQLDNALTSGLEPHRETIPSDLPYACNAGYSMNIDDFLKPVRIVTRLPDINRGGGLSDPGEFIQVIRSSAELMTLSEEEYKDSFLLSASNFYKKEQKTAKRLYPKAALLSCPPETGNWSNKQYSCLNHYSVLYGKKGEQEWYSDSACKTVAFSSENNTLPLDAGTIMITHTSYGAQLFMAGQEYPMANIYLMNQACAYLGSTCEVVGEQEGNWAGDILAEKFLMAIRKGGTIGSAFLDARNAVLDGKKTLSDVDKRVLAEYIILGDGGFQPMEKKESGGMSNEKETGNVKETRNVKERLQQMGIYDIVLQKLQQKGRAVSEEDITLPPLPEDIKVLEPSNKELSQNYVFVYPKTIDELRCLVGVPREVANYNKDTYMAREYSSMNLLHKDNSEKDILAHELLVAPDESLDDLVNDFEKEKLKMYIMERAKCLPILMADQLIVENGETKEIKNTAAAVFDSITIYGTGKIIPADGIKIVTNTLKHIR